MNPVGVFVGLIRFETFIALTLAATPVALRLADDRGSISAYHDMSDPRWYFVPLTAAAMMLITNGLVRSEAHGHNAVLGALLLGVVLFDHDGGSAVPHFLSAVPFFVLGLLFVVLMVTHYTATSLGWPRRGVVTVGLAAAVAGVLGLAWLLLDPPTFWLEAVGIWIMAAHHGFHAWWEIVHPDDGTEPAAVFGQLWPNLYRMLARLLAPFVALWNWFNAHRPPPVTTGGH